MIQGIRISIVYFFIIFNAVSAHAATDLMIGNILLVPTQPLPGEAVRLKAAVRNAGTTAVAKGKVVRISFQVTKGGITSEVNFANYTGGIPARTTVVIEATNGPSETEYYQIPQGNFSLKAVVQAPVGIADSNSSNNVKTMAFGFGGIEAPRTGVMPVQSDLFTDFMGINVHLNWGGTVYDTRYNDWKSRLEELKIRYVRTSGTLERDRQRMTQLNQEQGIKFLYTFNERLANKDLDRSSIPKKINFLINLGTGKILGLESANEYSDTKYNNNNTNWASELIAFQQDLYEQAKAKQSLQDLPVLAPTIWRRYLNDFQAIGDLSNFSDSANLHYYNGGTRPSIWNDNGPNADKPLDDALSRAQITSHNKVYITEMGYNTKNSDPKADIPDDVVAKYALREYSVMFQKRDKITKAFVYQLMDVPNSPDPTSFGLLNPDASPKPSFYAIKNANAILADPGLPHAVQPLNYMLSGDMSNISYFITQKRNGNYLFVIHQEVTSYHRDDEANTKVPVRNLKLDVSSHGFLKAKFYRPTALGLANKNNGSKEYQIINVPKQIDLPVGDELLIVELSK